MEIYLQKQTNTHGTQTTNFVVFHARTEKQGAQEDGGT